MQRINLGAPYENFIKSMIESGYYGTATEVIRDALRDKMEKVNSSRQTELYRLLKEGEDDIAAGRTVPYDDQFFDRVMEAAKRKSENGGPIPDHVKP